MGNRILIVDDQMGIRRLLREVLESAGFDVIEASNGLDGVAIVQSKHPDLVLLDIKMPGIDGQEALRRIRQYDVKIPVVIMSAYGDMDFMQCVEALGVVASVTKPFDIMHLIEIIMSLLYNDGVPEAVS